MISNEELIKRFADYVYYFHAYCTSDVEDHEMLKAVLALLKEQEAKEVEAEVINEIDRLYRCPSCHISMMLRGQPYCHYCGQELKWE